jgi:hypothetical protein
MSTAGGSSPEIYRVFIASLPEPVKREIEQAQEQLRCAVRGKCVRWARREQLHLTLKFLGNVEVPRLDELTASIRGACAAFGALQRRAGPNPGTRSSPVGLGRRARILSSAPRHSLWPNTYH